MLLDEPFGALDSLTRTEMQEWLLKVWEQFRRTVVFITHDIREAVFLSDRVYVLTARPASVRLSRSSTSPGPGAAIVTSPGFVAIEGVLFDALREESQRAHRQAGEEI